MKNRKGLLGISSILFVFGVSLCFGVALAGDDTDTEVPEISLFNFGAYNVTREEKVSFNLDEEQEKTLIRLWKKTNKNKKPSSSDYVREIIGDYVLFVGQDEIYFNVGVNYVYYNDRYVAIDDEFVTFLKSIVAEEPKYSEDGTECCSCCPDLKEGESCIAACCKCSN